MTINKLMFMTSYSETKHRHWQTGTQIKETSEKGENGANKK